MKKFLAMFFTAAAIAVAGTAAMLFMSRGNTVSAAERYAVHQGDLYLVGNNGQSRQITRDKKITVIFDERNGLLLYGQRDNALAASDATPVSHLYLRTVRGVVRKSTDKPVREAVFGQGAAIFFVTADADLYVKGENGEKKLAEDVLNPAPSPDGRFIVYQKLPPDWQAGELFDRALGLTVLNLSDGSEMRLTHRWEDFSPFWHPDGSRIYFHSIGDSGDAALFSISKDGGELIQLTNRAGEATMPLPSERPVWSPDGKAILYESDREIWLLEFVGSMAHGQQLGYGKRPQWNADETINVVIGAEGSPSIMTIDRHGSILEK